MHLLTPPPLLAPPTLQLSLDMLALPGGAAALRLWSAEEPHLYLLLLSLVASSGSGCVLEIEACQVGRELAVRWELGGRARGSAA